METVNKLRTECSGNQCRGERLMELHIDYEKQPEYKLEQIEDPKPKSPSESR